MMGALAQVVLVVYFAAFFVWAGPLLREVWAEGGHATSEQWAYHTLFESLGITHHHGPEDRFQPAREPLADGEAIRVVPPVGTIVISMPSTFGVPYDGTFLQIVEAFGSVHVGDAPRYGVSIGRIAPSGLRPDPPEKPPPIVR